MKHGTWTKAAWACGLLVLAGTAFAQSYPAKPVRLIVPFPADGYTLMMVVSSFVTNPALYPNLPFDPLKDFTPVSLLTSAPLVLVVHPSLPVKSVRELVALAKARPGELNYAAAGNGAGGHLAMELFKGMAGINMVTIIYKGGAQAVTDVIGGQVQLTVNNPIVVLPHVKSGRLRALAVTSAQRLAAAPELPTIAESGVPGFEASLWYGVVTPPGLPAPLVGRLNTELLKALQHPDTRERLALDGVRIIGSTPEQFGEHLRHESVKWTKVVRDARIKLE
ncbi:MAG: tripartite tricarboxylate transporter substrate binding protein [Betaproteobacteria bacterium]|nr:tripartite tricarboxylate transporter substrate binding protein [Betaproteobacteria bacterium]